MSETEAKVETKEQPEEKKKSSRAKKEKAPKEVAAAAESTRSSGRAVKKPERFEPEKSANEFKAAEIVKGKGTKLVDIPNVEAHMSKTKPKEGFLKKLYRLVFPGASVKETHIKKDLREFSGFSDNSADHVASVTEKLSKFDMNALRQVADLLDVERTSKKEELAERIATFLHKPVASGRELKPKAKKSRSGEKGTKEKTKKEGSSRGPSPYILFSTENRAKAKAENPTLTFGELGKLLGERWRELSDEEKQKYKDAAAAAPKKDKPAKKRKASTKKEGTKKKKSKKSSDDKADDKEDDDAEDAEEDEEDEAGDDDADDAAGDDEAAAGADE